MVKLSANLGFLWTELPLLERIDAAAAAGFKAIELHWPYDVPAQAVKDASAAHGLTVLALNMSRGGAAGDFGLGAIDGRQREFKAALDQSIGYVRAIGGNAIHVLAGVVAPQDKPRAREVLIDNLKLAASKAPDLMLLLEPINLRDRPGYFYSTAGEASDIIAAAGAGNVKIMFDVYHIAVSEGDILKRLERHMPQIGHVQIAAIPSRAEPDEGELAYRTVFDTLDALGYSGWVGCEYRPRAGTEAGARLDQDTGRRAVDGRRGVNVLPPRPSDRETDDCAIAEAMKVRRPIAAERGARTFYVSQSWRPQIPRTIAQPYPCGN